MDRRHRRMTRWQTAEGRWWRSCDVCHQYAWDEELSDHPNCPGLHKQIAITCPAISARPLLTTFAKTDGDQLILTLSIDDLTSLAASMANTVHAARDAVEAAKWQVPQTHP